MKIRQYEVDKDSCSDNARGFLNAIKQRLHRIGNEFDLWF